MLDKIKRASPLILGAVAFLIIWWIVGSSQAFQTCINDTENGAANDPLQKQIPIFVREFWVYRRCLGAYVIEKHAAITAIGTLAIAIFTAILGGFTISLSKSTRDAALAAKKSADAAVSVERGRFFIVLKNYNLSHLIKAVKDNGRLTPGENISIEFYFKNYGKTPGILKERVIGSVIAEELPDTLPLPLSVKDFPETMIGAGNCTKPDWFGPDTFPTGPEIGEVGRNNKRFWFYGRLYYDDVFGDPQVHCFYFRSKSNVAGDHCVLEPVEPKAHKKST